MQYPNRIKFQNNLNKFLNLKKQSKKSDRVNKYCLVLKLLFRPIKIKKSITKNQKEKSYFSIKLRSRYFRS